MTALSPAVIDEAVRIALAEDVGRGDITTALTVPPEIAGTAEVTAKSRGVVAGVDVAKAVLKTVDAGLRVDVKLADGNRVEPGDVIFTVTGSAAGILTAERVALNFLQRMSGTATMTARFVELVAGTSARIVDTRKTTPGLRAFEKYAVTVGGGVNHRFGLYDGILIKDNHIAAAGGVRQAVISVKGRAPHTLKVEVEVTSLNQLEEALEAGADAVLLDNMSCEMMRKAVELVAGRAVTEASGGVNEANVRLIAETGVDLISVGALTHSAPALDISLDLKCEK